MDDRSNVTKLRNLKYSPQFLLKLTNTLYLYSKVINTCWCVCIWHTPCSRRHSNWVFANVKTCTCVFQRRKKEWNGTTHTNKFVVCVWEKQKKGEEEKKTMISHVGDFTLYSNIPRIQLQIFKGKQFQTNFPSQIAAMAYLDLILRSVTEPALLKIFIKFLLDETKFDGDRVLDVLVERLMSPNNRVSVDRAEPDATEPHKLTIFLIGICFDYSRKSCAWWHYRCSIHWSVYAVRI